MGRHQGQGIPGSNGQQGQGISPVGTGRAAAGAVPEARIWEMRLRLPYLRAQESAKDGSVKKEGEYEKIFTLRHWEEMAKPQTSEIRAQGVLLSRL